MGDLSIATARDASARSSIVSLGENSLKEALDSVEQSTHRDEVYLALEALGLILGVVLLRRSAAPSRR